MLSSPADAQASPAPRFSYALTLPPQILPPPVFAHRDDAALQLPLDPGLALGQLPYLRRRDPAEPATQTTRDPAAAAGLRYAGLPAGVLQVILVVLLAIAALVLLYSLRHFVFTLNRLFGQQSHTYADLDSGNWPYVTVLVAAHNEEAVIAHALAALLQCDYPPERLEIMPVNDRSTDRTYQVIEQMVARHPGRIRPFHRTHGKPGKSAALRDATPRARGDILVVFDADYLPGSGLIKQLVAPFFDPEIGITMGRVVPHNTSANLLTRLLDLERSAGYQVDQQARMNLRLVPQYGGTVGGVRRVALEACGGWREDALAEDTDLTCRLLLDGWGIAYLNRSECYEESPQDWPTRVRQIMRWARGHNQAAVRYLPRLLCSRTVSLRQKFDGALLLGTYAMSPLLVLGCLLTLFLYHFSGNGWLVGVLALFGLMAYSALGNFAAFLEIGAAVHLDGSTRRIWLLPLNSLGFLVSLVSIFRASCAQLLLDRMLDRPWVWDKTQRYRALQPAGAVLAHA